MKMQVVGGLESNNRGSCGLGNPKFTKTFRYLKWRENLVNLMTYKAIFWGGVGETPVSISCIHTVHIKLRIPQF